MAVILDPGLRRDDGNFELKEVPSGSRMHSHAERGNERFVCHLSW